MFKEFVDFYKEVFCTDFSDTEAECQGDDDQEDSIMICPYCGREMRDGALRSCKAHIKWDEGPNTIDWLGWKTLLAAHLTADEGLGTSRVTSYFCPDCKKIIINTDVV